VVVKAFTDFGTSSEKMVAKWELVNFTELSDDWKLLNEKGISAAVKSGVKAIKGLRIWEEQEVSFRSK